MKMKSMFSYVSVAALAAATAFTVTPAHASAALASAAPTAAAQGGQDQWETPPPELRGAEQQGFHDGIEGARKDAENHRPPNVNNRDEYRHPSVSHRERRAYREGFRRGYRVGVEHLMGRDHHDHDRDHDHDQ
jgi:hypothetical protein